MAKQEAEILRLWTLPSDIIKLLLLEPLLIGYSATDNSLTLKIKNKLQRYYP